MNKLGLVSVSFRKHSVEEIINLARLANLKCIEWGSDIHVPETDFENAKRVAELTQKAGLFVSAYGTYYKLGQGMDFAPFLKTAKLLRTTNLRVWAGNKKPSDVTVEERKLWTKEAKEISAQAQKEGCRVLFEYHPNTLTETADSALQLIKDVDEESCRLYWQPWYKLSTQENVNELKKVYEYVEMVHMFYWEDHSVRRFLKEGKDEIKEFLKIITTKDIPILLEFLPQDNCVYVPYEAQSLFDLTEEVTR